MTGKTILQVAPELSAGGVERTVLEVTEAIIQAGGRALLASRGGRQE
ncbi:MAG TPA: glycosyl transferase, partial [Hyphomonas sp.]|nr:glycosyl transferase [Hyphomonas sp.]